MRSDDKSKQTEHVAHKQHFLKKLQFASNTF